MKTNVLFLLLILSNIGVSCQGNKKESNASKSMKFNVEKSEEEWKKQLGDEAYIVLRKKGTERPFSGTYYYQNETGIYHCAGCEAPLFTSDTKFDAGCGWPSFYKPINDSCIIEVRDLSHGMIRTEVICANCGGHLGHVFDDAPDQPTGLRYCINSVSIGFDKKEK
jgi:peptide-methionine (R)-S-oxide reductase